MSEGYVICRREHVRAVETAGRVAVQVRLPAGWATLCAGDADGRAVDDLLEELQDVIAELSGRLAELRAIEEDTPDDARAVYRTYRAMSGYGPAIGRAAAG